MKIAFAFTKPQVVETVGSVIPKGEDAAYAFSQTELQQVLKRNGKELDYLFVHEDIYAERYPWEWLSYLKENTGAKTRIIVNLSENTDSLYREIMKRISIDFGISLIPYGLTATELAEEISSRLYDKPKTTESSDTGKVVTVMSASPKDGATTVAISTAICAAQRLPDKKVLLVDFNLKSPEIRDHLHVTSDKGYPLIQADCDSGTLEKSALMKACEQLKGIPNLYIITGIQRREWAEKITLEEVDHFLTVARATFDLVFVDVHTYPDQAATLRCVKDADERLVVVQPIVTSYQSSWNDWFNSVWQHYGLTETDFHLVMNRDIKTAMDGFQIEMGMGAKIVTRIRNVDKGAGIRAVNYGQPIYLDSNEDSKEFQTNILQLTSWLMERIRMELVPLESDKKSALKVRRRLFGIL